MKLCRVPRAWHLGLCQGVFNMMPTKTCLNCWCMCGRIVSRRMTASGVTQPKEPSILRHSQKLILTTENRSSICVRINPSTKLLVGGYGVLHTRSKSTGGKTHMSHQRFHSASRLHGYPLVEWLDSRSRSDRAAIWARELNSHGYDSRNIPLPTILLAGLEGKEASKFKEASMVEFLDASSLHSLQNAGFKPDDVDLWAYILTAPTTEEGSRRLLDCQVRTPTFVLLEVLRQHQPNPALFHSLLLFSYNHVGFRGPLPSDSIPEVTDALPNRSKLQLSTLVPPEGQPLCTIEQTDFEVLVSHLTRYARRVLPSALISLSSMVVSYCEALVDDHRDVSPSIYKRICKTYNKMLLRFSLPASIHPLKSMTYNWEAQKKLLISAANWVPPVQLNKSSYKAVSQVLLASKKSPEETHFASLTQRTWPPWRRELDGMDVARSPDADISRAVAALSRMKEAGYAGDSIVRALTILGGREPDGTPTIQTRQVTTELQGVIDPAWPYGGGEGSSAEWAARITATRDVYEAWAAFQGFTRDGQRPSHSMYHAMFEKLIYRDLTDTSRQSLEIVAGDAKEPLPTIDENITEGEKFRIAPPDVGGLFPSMIADGIRPSGRLLQMLISKAPSFEAVALYMHHGGAPRNALIELLRKPTEMQRSALKTIPYGTFTAFIRFLCRFRRWRIVTPSDTASGRVPVGLFRRPADPVFHAFALVKCLSYSSPIAWNVVFCALARRKLVFEMDSHQSQNDVMSWLVLKPLVTTFLKEGMYLDPDGFRYVCITLEKALIALPYARGTAAPYIRKGSKLVKERFRVLSEDKEAVYGLSRLVHGISGLHLHSYVRVLGLLKDTDELMFVLQWMVKHREELTFDAKLAHNGLKLLRRSIIAVRVFFAWNEEKDEVVVDRLKEIIGHLNDWGVWPTDDEVMDYLNYDDIPGLEDDSD